MNCSIIAEVGLAHDGSLGTAHAYIDAIAKSGVDGVKFQMHIAESESTIDEEWRVRFSPQDSSRFEYWKRTEFTDYQWEGLRVHAAEVGLKFICSPFSVEAVRKLARLNVDAWKIASGEVTNPLLVAAIAEDSLPVLLSNGLATDSEMLTVVRQFEDSGKDVTVLQCTTSYPCPPEEVDLLGMVRLREEFNLRTGLSDHSGEIYAGLAAATLGAEVIEVHAVFSKSSFGPDAKASLTIEQLSQLVAGVRFVEKAKSGRGRRETDRTCLREIFGRSVCVARRVEPGHVLELEDLTLKKPGTGISPESLTSLVGRVARVPLHPHKLLRLEDLE